MCVCVCVKGGGKAIVADSLQARADWLEEVRSIHANTGNINRNWIVIVATEVSKVDWAWSWPQC